MCNTKQSCRSPRPQSPNNGIILPLALSTRCRLSPQQSRFGLFIRADLDVPDNQPSCHRHSRAHVTDIGLTILSGGLQTLQGTEFRGAAKKFVHFSHPTRSKQGKFSRDRMPRAASFCIGWGSGRPGFKLRKFVPVCRSKDGHFVLDSAPNGKVGNPSGLLSRGWLQLWLSSKRSLESGHKACFTFMRPWLERGLDPWGCVHACSCLCRGVGFSECAPRNPGSRQAMSWL